MSGEPRIGATAASGHLAKLLVAAAAGPARPVRVHVERVALAGLALTPAQSRAFGAALAAELRGLAREPGWRAATAAVRVPGVVAPAVLVAPGADPVALGRDVARSVFSALRGLA